jgi:plastocyanin
MRWPVALPGVALAALALMAAACGSDSGAPPAPSPPPAATTITIASSGVSPKNLIVSPGTQVTFVNNDSISHEMDSDPHPEHTDCPAINDVDLLAAGQRKLTGNLNAVRTCGYHDHQHPTDERWHGTITIQ